MSQNQGSAYMTQYEPKSGLTSSIKYEPESGLTSSIQHSYIAIALKEEGYV
jgi:hypothetical protein